MSDILVIAACPLEADRGSPIRIRRRIALQRRMGHRPVVASYRRWRLAPKAQGFSWRKLPCDAELAVRAVRLARRHRPSVIEGHVHEGLAIALLARLVSPRSKVVYDAHGTLADELVATGHVRTGGVVHRLATALEGWLERRADVVLAQSEHRRSGIVGHGVDAARVLVCVDAPEPELFAIDRPARGPRATAVYTGSLAPYQGVDDILAAATATPHVDYVVFGGPAGDYPERAVKLGIAGRVSFVDPAPADQLAAVLAGADIALAPRRYGGNIPGKVPAYQAAGLPTVGTRVAGITELVDEATGAVVEPGDVAALADAINALAVDAPRRERLGRAARTRAAGRYTEDAVRLVLEQAYQP